jgi:hypothetical protein
MHYLVIIILSLWVIVDPGVVIEHEPQPDAVKDNATPFSIGILKGQPSENQQP